MHGPGDGRDSAHLRRLSLNSVAMASGVTLGRRRVMNFGTEGDVSVVPGGCGATDWWQPVGACSSSQRCSTLAFIPWLLAKAAMEDPFSRQAATSSALKASVLVRWVRLAV